MPKNRKKKSKVVVRRKPKHDRMTVVWTVLFSILTLLVGFVLIVDWVQVYQGYTPLVGVASAHKVDKTPPPEAQSPRSKGQSSASRKSEPSPVPEPTIKSTPRSAPVRARVGIIIDDIGLDLGVVKQLLAIEQPLAFSVLPFQPHTRAAAKLAHNAGRVVMAHVPMETKDPTKMQKGLPWLLVGMNVTTVHKTLDSIIADVSFAIGVNNHTGSRYTAHQASMEMVLDYCQNKGLFFVDSRTTTTTKALSVARKKKIPSARRDVFFDDADDFNLISDQFERMIQVALKNKTAIGIGHPRDNTVTALKKYIPIMKKKGITIVPVTTLLSPQLHHPYLAHK